MRFPGSLNCFLDTINKGYKPISLYDFEREMEIAVNGINIHLRGTAFRIRARQAEIRGDDPGVIEKLLSKSESDQEKVADPIELAKTRAEIARLKLRQGAEKEALDLALLAWEGLSPYGEGYFPNVVKSLLQRKSALTKGGNRDDGMLTRYMEMIEDFIPSAGPDELLFRLRGEQTVTEFESIQNQQPGFIEIHGKRAKVGIPRQYMVHLIRSESLDPGSPKGVWNSFAFDSDRPCGIFLILNS